MERICLLPEHVLIDLVEYVKFFFCLIKLNIFLLYLTCFNLSFIRYALCMLECSNDSSRCHAAMFFSYSFHFRVIREIFDDHNGLCKLFHVV